MKIGNESSFAAMSTTYLTLRYTSLFHSPSHSACGCLPILSRMAALAGSVPRTALARKMASDSGSTQSFAPFNGLPSAFGGVGASAIGASSAGALAFEAVGPCAAGVELEQAGNAASTSASNERRKRVEESELGT
jgi:hypothetical protein